jgi:hypothetical protein
VANAVGAGHGGIRAGIFNQWKSQSVANLCQDFMTNTAAQCSQTRRMQAKAFPAINLIETAVTNGRELTQRLR